MRVALEDDLCAAKNKPRPGDGARQKEGEPVIGTDTLLVFVPGPDSPSERKTSLKKGIELEGACERPLRTPKLRLVRPALEIAQPIVPVAKQPGRNKESYSDEILRLALDRMISHAAHELLDDATRPFFEPSALAETAVQAVIEPKTQVRSGEMSECVRTESSASSQALAEMID